MAQKKFSGFTVGAAITGAGQTKLAGLQGGDNVTVTDEQLKSFLSGRNLLSTVAVTGASANFTANINSTYALYEFHLERVIPATGGAYLLLEVSDDAGATWKTTGYVSTCGGFNGATSGSDVDTAAIILSGKGTNLSGVDNNKAGLSGVLRCHAPAASARCTFEGDVSYVATTSFNQVIARPGGRYDSVAVITAVRFRFSSGNLSAGTIRMYGIKTA